jgi:PTS system nitrogen regulatory IIA component
MKITEILVRDAVILNLGVRTKNDVLAEMTTALAKVEPQISADRLHELLLEREALQSTGIGDGGAIPHGKVAGLDRLVATFARSVEGVDFESIDGQPTHHLFMLVVPEHSGGKYLKALARISRFFRDPAFRQRLSDAETLEDVMGAIEDEDAKL